MHLTLELKNIGTNDSIFVKYKNGRITHVIECMIHVFLNTSNHNSGYSQTSSTRREPQRGLGDAVYVFFLGFSLLRYSIHKKIIKP